MREAPQGPALRNSATKRKKRVQGLLRERNEREAATRLRKLGLALFDAVDGATDLFACPICRKLLTAPVTADCGHTFCVECLDKVNLKCVVCCVDVGSLRATNVLVQEIVTKWREIHAGNENGEKLQTAYVVGRTSTNSINFVTIELEEGRSVPETADILGIEPRYYLRSRNAGIQPRAGCAENNVTKIIRRLILPQRKVKCKEEYWGQARKKRRGVRHNLKDSFTNGDISSRGIITILKKVDIIREKASYESWKHMTPSDLECILCSRCFLDPVTTKCGHTFCRGCLARVIDHGLACPLCMAPLSPFDETRGTTAVIESAIKFLAPNEYRQRVAAHRQEIKILEKESKVPVFVCTNAFPGVACPLYVYEPRYRLLARRCLQSRTRRFAMAARTDNAEKFAPFGTILEVRDAVHLHDGTSILTTVGVRRFRVIEKGEQDGYDTATVQYIKDNIVSPEKLPELLALHQRVYSKAARWVRSLTPRVLAEVENCIGRMPDLEEAWFNLPDGPAWAWWLMPVLPLSPKLQIGFLFTTDLQKRLRAIDKMLEHMKIKMRALKQNTLKCADTVENSDSCRLSWIL